MIETRVEYTTFQLAGDTVEITTPDPEFFIIALDIHRGALNPATAAERCARICEARIAAAQAGMVGEEEETVAIAAAEMDVLHAARRLAAARRVTDTGDITALCELDRRERLLVAAVDTLEAQNEPS